MQKNSIGLPERSSVAAGMLVTDTMLKAVSVELLIHRTICSGKRLILGADQIVTEAG